MNRKSYYIEVSLPFYRLTLLVLWPITLIYYKHDQLEHLYLSFLLCIYTY